MGDLLIAEDPQLPITNPGRPEQQAQRCSRPHSFDVDLLSKDGPQGIQVERVELVGRELGRDRRQQWVRQEYTASGASLADLAPEPLQAGPCFVYTAAGQPGGEQDSVHCAGAGSTHGVERRVLLQEAVEHAPGKGAERTSALQG